MNNPINCTLCGLESEQGDLFDLDICAACAKNLLQQNMPVKTDVAIHDAKLEFRLSKLKLSVFVPLALLMLWLGYLMLSSNQIIGRIVGCFNIIVFLSAILYILYGLTKQNNNMPIIVFDSNGIYLKGFSKQTIPWSNIRLIWKSSMTSPRRLYIESLDQSPSGYPHNLIFTFLTPGFNDAWHFIKTNHPEKLQGTSRFC